MKRALRPTVAMIVGGTATYGALFLSRTDAGNHYASAPLLFTVVGVGALVAVLLYCGTFLFRSALQK
jgi:hypothetical protein